MQLPDPASPSLPIIAVLLAAGKGARFTAPAHKLTIPINGVPIVRRTALNCLTADFAAVVAVTGANSETILPLLQDLQLHVVFNPDWESGQFSSLLAGLKAARTVGAGDRFAACFVLADQPFVRAATYNDLIRAARENPTKIIVPRFKEKRGNPTVFPERFFPEMLSAPIDDSGGRRWLTEENIRFLDVDDPGVLKDIDRVSDLPGNAPESRRGDIISA